MELLRGDEKSTPVRARIEGSRCSAACMLLMLMRLLVRGPVRRGCVVKGMLMGFSNKVC